MRQMSNRSPCTSTARRASCSRRRRCFREHRRRGASGFEAGAVRCRGPLPGASLRGTSRTRICRCRPFDHSAVDGFGVTEADVERPPPHRLGSGRVTRPAGGRIAPAPPAQVEAVRLFTGAPMPRRGRRRSSLRSAAVLEPGRHCGHGPRSRRERISAELGEDVPFGSVIVEAGHAPRCATHRDTRRGRCFTGRGATADPHRRPLERRRAA